MRYTMMIAIVAMVMLVAGCGNKPGSEPAETPDVEQAGFAGYVVDIENNRILVVNSTERNFGSGGAQHYFEAIWFSKAPSDIEIGQRVEVWSDGDVLDSYPAQGQADRVSVLETRVPEGAKLTEPEAIRKALASPAIADFMAPAILETKYDSTASVWSISITHNGDETVNVVQVDDKPAVKDEELGVTPPQPTIMAGEIALAVHQSSYCWSSESQKVCADTMGPLDIMKDKTMEQLNAGEKIAVSFDTSSPAEVHVIRYGEGNSAEEQVAAESFQAPMEPGKYIYGINAYWPNNVQGVGGSSSYAIGFEVK